MFQSRFLFLMFLLLIIVRSKQRQKSSENFRYTSNAIVNPMELDPNKHYNVYTLQKHQVLKIGV
jgi:hypothetical protein